MKHNYAFIDAQNVNISIQNQGWKIDWKKFRQYLTDTYAITKAYLFLGFMPEYQHMYDFLQESGYILIFKPVHIIKNKATKGNVDAELVLQTMIEYKNYDGAIIVSGDGDFACLVDHLYMHEKLLRLIVPNSKQFSLFLKHVAKEKIDSLSDLQHQLEFISNDPATASLDTDAAIDLLPTRSPLKYLGDKIKQLLKKPTTKERTPLIAKKPVHQGQEIKKPFARPTQQQTIKKPLQQTIKKPTARPIEIIKKSTQQVQHIQQVKKPFVRPVQVSPKPIQNQELKHSRVQPLQSTPPHLKIQEVKKPFVRPVQTTKKPVQQPVVQIIKKPITPVVQVQQPVQVPQTSPVVKKHIHKHYNHSKVSVTPIPNKPIPDKPINKKTSNKPFVRSPRKKTSPQRYKSDFLE